MIDSDRVSSLRADDGEEHRSDDQRRREERGLDEDVEGPFPTRPAPHQGADDQARGPRRGRSRCLPASAGWRGGSGRSAHAPGSPREHQDARAGRRAASPSPSAAARSPTAPAHDDRQRRVIGSDRGRQRFSAATAQWPSPPRTSRSFEPSGSAGTVRPQSRLRTAPRRACPGAGHSPAVRSADSPEPSIARVRGATAAWRSLLACAPVEATSVIRSPRSTASSMLWVMKTTVLCSAPRSGAVPPGGSGASARRGPRTARPAARSGAPSRARGPARPAAACRRTAPRHPPLEAFEPHQPDELARCPRCSFGDVAQFQAEGDVARGRARA